jgi:hypothetical protein
VAKKNEKKSLKTNNDSIALTSLSNNRTWIEMIQDNAFMMFPEKDDWRKRFSLTLMEWAAREDSLDITDFTLEMKMHRSMFYRWIDKYPDIKQTYETAKLMLASRRRKGALTKRFDKDVVFKDLHKYDSEWLEINKYHSDMKKDEEKQAHTFIISDSKPRVVSKEELLKNKEDNDICVE